MLEHVPFIGDWHRSIKLGCDSFADVWVWQHSKSKEKVVIKTCNLLMSPNENKARERWLHEIDLMTTKIHHLNIVRGIQVQPDSFLIELTKLNPSGMPTLITEYCAGGNLRQLLNDSRNASGMIESDVRNIFESLKNATFYLHSLSIIHRDIKPENVAIHLTSDGRKVYKLTDLGYRKPIDFRTMEASVVGKMVYIAPELITSDKYSFSADYWSIGMVLYELCTGQRPFVPHLPLAQWVLRVREKKSDHITISEEFNGEFIYSNKIYPENQLSSKFVTLLENWFKIALEWNPKQRGYVFETLNESNDPKPPVQVLKFFQNADDILATKILTAFVLTNHKFVSMEINENTTKDEFTGFIERSTGIPKAKCHIVVSTYNPKIDENSIDFDKPFDWYIDDYFDKPMVFIAKIDEFDLASTPADNGKNENEIFPTDVPMSVQSILKNHEQRLKVHSLRKFANDTLYFVQNENKNYQTCLDGWFNFAQQLSHCINTCQENVRHMQTLIYGVFGALELFNQTLEMTKERFQGDDADGWFDQHTKIIQNVELLVSACDKITIRFGSVYRRCREAFQNELFAKRSQNFYDIINVTKAYEMLCKHISSNSYPPKPHFELFQCAFKCLKQRDSLLRNKNFIEMQRNLLCIQTEFTEIKKALEKAVLPAEKYRVELANANKKLHDHIWSKIESSETPTVNMVATSTSDLPSDLIHEEIATKDASTNTDDNAIANTNANAKANSSPNSSPNVNSNEANESHLNELFAKKLRKIAIDENSEKTKLLIEDNINLRIGMADLMNDFDEKLKIDTN